IALPPGAGAAHLHQLTHRRGHTLLLLVGPRADPAAPTALRAELEVVPGDSPLVEAVKSLRLEESSGLGLGPLTLLAVRPDGFIGLRADTDHREALGRYRQLVRGQ
ncbi:monooxygenase, partial [Synechococcus sp. BA-124 BA4]|nr:monooxygenase [Synechococcus sp. BA-124 BA4]